MKVTRLFISVSVFLLLITLTASTASPNTSFLMSFWASDTDIDISATLKDFQDSNTLDIVNDIHGNRSARIYVKNDANHLWIAFRLRWAYTEEVVANSTAILSIDGDHDGFWAEDCKIIEDGTLTDSYFLRGKSAIYPDVDQVPDFGGMWSKVDARSEQGDADEQLLYFTIPLTSDEYLYDMNIHDINNRLIGIGLLIENENESIRFLGHSADKGDSSGFLTISLASAGDVPAPEYQPPGGESSAETSTLPYEPGIMEPGAKQASGFEVVGLLATMTIITALVRLRAWRNH
ncbi:MAG: hypothetical protein ACFFD4_05365 [Candidatus Odinarchaeota archaeon]